MMSARSVGIYLQHSEYVYVAVPFLSNTEQEDNGDPIISLLYAGIFFTVIGFNCA